MAIPTFDSYFKLDSESGIPELHVTFEHSESSVDILCTYTAAGISALRENPPDDSHADIIELATDVPSTDGTFVHQFIGSGDDGWPTAGAGPTVMFVAVRDHDTPADISVSWYREQPDGSGVSASGPNVYLTHTVAERIPVPDDVTSINQVIFWMDIYGKVCGSLRCRVFEWDTSYENTVNNGNELGVAVAHEDWMTIAGSICNIVFDEPVDVESGTELLFLFEMDDDTTGSQTIGFGIGALTSNQSIPNCTTTNIEPIGETIINVTNGDAGTVSFKAGSVISFGSGTDYYVVKEDVDIDAGLTDDITIEPALKSATSAGGTITSREGYYLDGSEQSGKRLHCVYGNYSYCYFPPRNVYYLFFVHPTNYTQYLGINAESADYTVPRYREGLQPIYLSGGRTLEGRDTRVPLTNKRSGSVYVRRIPSAQISSWWRWVVLNRFILCPFPNVLTDDALRRTFMIRCVSGAPEFTQLRESDDPSYYDIEINFEEE